MSCSLTPLHTHTCLTHCLTQVASQQSRRNTFNAQTKPRIEQHPVSPNRFVPPNCTPLAGQNLRRDGSTTLSRLPHPRPLPPPSPLSERVARYTSSHVGGRPIRCSRSNRCCYYLLSIALDCVLTREPGRGTFGLVHRVRRKRDGKVRTFLYDRGWAPYTNAGFHRYSSGKRSTTAI